MHSHLAFVPLGNVGIFFHRWLLWIFAWLILLALEVERLLGVRLVGRDRDQNLIVIGSEGWTRGDRRLEFFRGELDNAPTASASDLALRG